MHKSLLAISEQAVALSRQENPEAYSLIDDFSVVVDVVVVAVVVGIVGLAPGLLFSSSDSSPQFPQVFAHDKRKLSFLHWPNFLIIEQLGFVSWHFGKAGVVLVSEEVGQVL